MRCAFPLPSTSSVYLADCRSARLLSALNLSVCSRLRSLDRNRPVANVAIDHRRLANWSCKNFNNGTDWVLPRRIEVKIRGKEAPAATGHASLPPLPRREA